MQYEAAVSVIMKILECKPRLLPFCNKPQCKNCGKVAVDVAQAKFIQNIANLCLPLLQQTDAHLKRITIYH